MNYSSAIFALVGVLIGALIPGIVSVWMVNKNHKHEQKSLLLEYRKNLYIAVVDILASSKIQTFQDYKQYHDEIIKRKSGDFPHDMENLTREPFTDILGNPWSDDKLQEHIDIICTNAKHEEEKLLEQFKSLYNQLQLFASDAVRQQVKEFQLNWIESYKKIILKDSMTSLEINKLYAKQMFLIETMRREYSI